MSNRIDFEISTFDFAAQQYGAWALPHRFHYVYLLENGTQAYIGQTADIIERCKDHHKKDSPNRPYHFQRIHVITGAKLHESAAKHYERILIRLMTADQKFQIVNRVEGSRRRYPEQNEYELGFDRLWPKLEAKGLVRHKTFQNVLNLGQYKYSPYICLTDRQNDTLTAIINAIDSGETIDCLTGFLPRPIYVEGDAGTGKTVVASSLYYYLKTNPAYEGMKIALVYSLSSVRSVIISAFKPIPGKYWKGILSPRAATKQHFDILICDEAQRLRHAKNLGVYISQFRKGNEELGLDETCDELDWLMKCADRVVLFRDPKQSVTPSDIPLELYNRRLFAPNRSNRPIELNEQMRILAGKDFVPYIYDLLYQQAQEPKRFDPYEFRLFSSFRQMMEVLKQREEAFGLCRLASSYAWKWLSEKAADTPDISIEGVDVWWNRQTGGWLENAAAKHEMGSIYTLAGVDLNYAAIVIGPDLYYDAADHQIKVDVLHFFDKKVKQGVSGEALKDYILNTYAVLLTRGIRGTFVYVCDDALRDYLRPYIPAYEP